MLLLPRYTKCIRDDYKNFYFRFSNFQGNFYLVTWKWRFHVSLLMIKVSLFCLGRQNSLTATLIFIFAFLFSSLRDNAIRYKHIAVLFWVLLHKFFKSRGITICEKDYLISPWFIINFEELKAYFIWKISILCVPHHQQFTFSK